MKEAEKLIAAGRELGDRLRILRFSEPVTHIYLPTDYAAAGYEGYLRKFGGGKKKVLFLGMNPGPYGMAQCGVPFGEVSLVKNWMKLDPEISRPAHEHPKRLITGMACDRSEVSGRRLWGYFSGKFPQAEDFFVDHMVMNYCPLVWMKESGANVTPDKIATAEIAEVDRACTAHLQRVIEVLDPSYLIGVGAFAEKKLLQVCGDRIVGKILHPSPASPAANRGWAGTAEAQLREILDEPGRW